MASDHLSTVLSALADPTRRGLLARLATGEATVGELAEPYDMSMAAISKHLKVLEKAGLVEQGRTAQYRPRKLNPKPLEELDAWLNDFREQWEDRLDRLDHYLTLLQKTEHDD
jgi:DNA-binding transcriptional ArsR family regulator